MLEPRFREGSIPHQVWQLMADGQRRGHAQIHQKLTGVLKSSDYVSVAMALTSLTRQGFIKREMVGGKYEYWREVAA